MTICFFNIWYRPLPSQVPEGGYNGPMTAEATAAKRKEIATGLRVDAAKLANADKPLAEFYRLAESLYYDKDPATFTKVEQTIGQYVANLKSFSAEQLTVKKDEAKHLRDVLNYLARWKVIEASFTAKVELDQIIKDQNWDKQN